MQTMGRLSAQPAPARRATMTDKIMCDAFLAAFLAGLPVAVAGTSYDGWVSDVGLADLWADRRAAGLHLPDLPYRVLRMTIDLTGTDRQGALVLALPLVSAPVAQTAPAKTPEPADWPQNFGAVVQTAPACLIARLHQFSLPLAQIQGWQVGQVLPLPGCTVNSVRLIALDGRQVGQAKLGQLAGKRAIRIEAELGLAMAELGVIGDAGNPVLGAKTKTSDDRASLVPQIGVDPAVLVSDRDV
jgi:flagellar motor switch protein FliM